MKSNEPLTLNVNISGSGNIKLIDMPEINLPNGFEKYEPKVSEQISRSNKISGKKTIDYLLSSMPQRSLHHRLLDSFSGVVHHQQSIALLQSAAADSGEESSDGDSVGCVHQAMLLTSAFYSMTSR